MSKELKNDLMILLEIEKEQAELRLKDQIKSIRYDLNCLERKLDNSESLNDSDGLQGNATYIDIYVSQVVAYKKAIERFKKHLYLEK